MKIDLTKDQYLKLLELIYIGDWVLNSYTVGEREDTKEYQVATQKFFSYAKEFGYEVLVDEHSGEYEVSRKFEDESQAYTYLNQYDNEVFWDELVERLARRDLAAKHGKTIITRVYKDEKLFNELEDIKEKYDEIFKQDGLKNLKLDNLD